MEREQANELVAGLGRQLGLPELTLDEDGLASLAIDDARVVTIAHQPDDGGDVVLATALDGVPPSPARLEQALAANFCWGPADGAVFGFDRASRRLVLRRRCPGANLDLAGLTAALEGLVSHALAWTKLLSQIGEPEPSARAEPPRTPVGGMRA